MAGSSISAFTEFVNETGPTYLTSQTDRVNDAAKTNYETIGYLSRGQQMSDVLQGGANIKDIIYLNAVRRARSYKPMEDQSYQAVQTGITWTGEWRCWMTDIVVTDQELELNAGATLNNNTRAQKFKDIWFTKQQQAHSDAMDYLEEKYWAVPNTLEMESATGQEMYSIPALVNEFTNGLPTSVHPGGAWTTKQGINPTTAGQTNWVPQQFDYIDKLPSTSGSYNAKSLIAVFDRAWSKLNFRPPPHDKQYFETETAQPINVVFTSLQGRLNLLTSYRASNNLWADVHDPFFTPMYGGAPVVYVAALDTAAIFPTGAGATLSTELDTAGTTNAGPRYFLIQPKYLRTIFHSERFMANLGKMKDVRQPTTNIWPIDTWSNTIARSLRRHAIIYPSADIS